MQLRHHTKHTSEEYVTQKAWREASLDRCPVHPGGGCGLSRHGTYGRVEPPGVRIARYYCPLDQQTFSLLPDCLSSWLRGSLDEVEQVVLKVEESSSVEKAADALRPDLELPGAVRWVRRRLSGVRAALLALITLFPGELGEVAKLNAVRECLGSERALVELRGIGALHLLALPRPLGFRPARGRLKRRGRSRQHETGPDPPGSSEV